MRIESDAIERILQNATETLHNSKMQIFEIVQAAQQEKDHLIQELQQIMEDLTSTIETVDELERQFRRSRIRLVEVSRDFKRYTEKDIQEAYETATKFQLNLTVNRKREEHLKQKRDELQQRIRSLERTLERAEAIMSQMSVVLEYLSGDLSQVTRILESAKNRQLIGLKIILAQEEERRRIAREMHDGPAQSMAHLALRTDIAERMLAKGELDVVKEELAELKRSVRAELEEVRKIIFNLRPMALDDLGLVPTLRKYTQDFEEKTKIYTRLDIRGREKRLPSAMEVALFRLVQESLSNAAKHAQATQVLVELSYEPEDRIRVSITDNGIGFDPGEWKAQLRQGGNHFGLVGMKERVELLEGTFEINSTKGAGTKVVIDVPINQTTKGEVNHE